MSDLTIKTHKVSHNAIVSTALQHELMYYRDQTSMFEWRVGDIVNEIWENPPTGPVTKKQVCRAVGFFYGKSERTVRYFAETAAQVSRDIRDKYDMLPFAFFVMAYRPIFRSHGLSEEVLEYAATNQGLSVDIVETNFLKRLGFENIPDDLIDTILNSDGETVHTTTLTFRNAGELRDAITQVIWQFLGDQIPDPVRATVTRGIELIMQALRSVG